MSYYPPQGGYGRPPPQAGPSYPPGPPGPSYAQQQPQGPPRPTYQLAPEPRNHGPPPGPPQQGYYPPQPLDNRDYRPPPPSGPPRPPPPPQAQYERRYDERPYDSGSGYGERGRGPGGGGGREVGGGGGGRRDGPGGGRRQSPDGRNSRPLGARDHDLEHRLARERKCRTLFVRNVAYDADLTRLRQSFAEHGEIKEFFDLVPKRGMVFITYFDLRIAQKARDATHGIQIMGRPIDVHYSLPRPGDQNADCTRDKNQGSILATLHNQYNLEEYELRRACERYGEIKTVKSFRDANQKVVEFFDSRGAVLFYDRMANQPFMGGTLELRFIWDELDPHLPPPPAAGPVDTGLRAPIPPPAPPVRAPPPRESRPFRSGEGPGYGQVRGKRGGSDRASSDRHDDRGGYPPGPPVSQNRYGEAPPGPPAGPPPDDRLEQARRVQDLLASLGGSGAASAPAPPPPAPAPSYQPPPQPARGYAPPDPRQAHPSFRPPPTQNYQPPPPPAAPVPAPQYAYNASPPAPPPGPGGQYGNQYPQGPPGQYRPPPPPGPGPGPGGYGARPPVPGQGDVSSLLAMLQQK